jgi:hypothetical protein
MHAGPARTPAPVPRGRALTSHIWMPCTFVRTYSCWCCRPARVHAPSVRLAPRAACPGEAGPAKPRRESATPHESTASNASSGSGAAVFVTHASPSSPPETMAGASTGWNRTCRSARSSGCGSYSMRCLLRTAGLRALCATHHVAGARAPVLACAELQGELAFLACVTSSVCTSE